MTSNNFESNQPKDLGALATSLPSRAAELLGQENLEAILEHEKRAANLLELAKLPNPFEVMPGQTESLITPEERAAMEAIDSMQDERGDSGRQETIDTARQVAPVLAEAVKRHNKLIVSQFDNAYEMYKAIMRQQDDLDVKDTEKVSAVLPNEYEMLEQIAEDLFTMTTVKDHEVLLDAEVLALMLDAKAVTVQKNPQMGERLRQLWAESVSRKIPKPTSEAKFEEYYKLSAEAENKSLSNWRVRRAHRSRTELAAYQRSAEKLPETCRTIRRRGSYIYGKISGLATAAAYTPAAEMWQALKKADKEFIENTYRRHDQVQQVLEDEELKQAAILAEMFIAAKAEAVENMLRTAGHKFSPEMRRLLHSMKEGTLRNWVKKFGTVALSGEINELDQIEADAGFRRACRDARDILVGGGRIDHPDARQLANTLHRLRFGKDGSITLDPEESGMVVGIVTGKINSLLNAVSRFEAEEPDEQVQKLQLDLPDQFKIIAGFDIDAALNNLKALLDDINERQVLLGSLPDANSEDLVANTIERLWRQRNLVQEPEEEQPAEETEEEVEAQQPAEPEQTEEELTIISEEMSNIAEQLDWVVFPAGTTEGDIRHILGENSVDLSRVNWERIRHLIHLANTYEGHIYRSQQEKKLGTNVPYLVAEFNIHGHNFAVAECPEIGNATYVVDEALSAGTWPELMGLSKADARHLGARRIIHPKEEGHLNKIIRTINGMLLVRAAG